MPNGLTPTSGNFYMFQDKTTPVADTSLEYAVRMCIASGIRPSRIQNFASLLGSVVPSMVNATYGTQGVVPDNQGALRGYPKPTMDINWEVIETQQINAGTSVETYDQLWVQPMINNIVGYDIVLTLTIDQTTGYSLPSEGENQVVCTFTIPAGYTYPTSTTGTSGGSGSGASAKWIVNSLDPATENDVVTFSATASTSQDTYYTPSGSDTYSDTLAYASQTIYSVGVRAITAGSACSATISGTETTKYFIPLTGSQVADGTEIWNENTLTTHLADGDYVINYVGLDDYNYFTVTSGIVSGYGTCTP